MPLPDIAHQAKPNSSSRENSQATLAIHQPPLWSGSLQAVLDHPPSVLPKRLFLGGLVFSCLFGTWAWFGRVQDVSHAQGRLIPQGETYKVQPAMQGAVVKVLVEEGQQVEQGQIIAELDSRLVETEIERLQDNLLAARLELTQTQQLLEKLQQEIQTRRAIVAADIQAQKTAIAKTESNAQTIRNLSAQLQQDAAASEARITRIKPLITEGAIAEDFLFQIEQSLRDRQRSITQNNGEIEQMAAEVKQGQIELARREAEGQQSELEATQQLHQLEVKATQLQAQVTETETFLKKARTELNQHLLYAPVDGVVSFLGTKNVGEVLQPGQTVAEIAPKQAKLVLSAIVPSREAGLVKPGMPVQLKFDAFPYQDYGIVSGTVATISPDSQLNEQLGAVYQVEVLPDAKALVNRQKPIPLQAGQTAQAEIVTRQRRIIEVLLDPILRIQKDNISL